MSDMGQGSSRRSARIATLRERENGEQATAAGPIDEEESDPEFQAAFSNSGDEDMEFESNDEDIIIDEAVLQGESDSLLQAEIDDDDDDEDDDDDDDEDNSDEEVEVEIEDGDGEDEQTFLGGLIRGRLSRNVIWQLQALHQSRSRQSRQAHQASMIKKYGKIPKDQPHMNNDLALAIKRASECCNPQTPAFPAAKRRLSINTAGALTMNTSMFLWERQCNACGDMRAWSEPQRRHMYGFHYLPNRPISLRDSMQSRAYIGQYSHEGDYFIAAFQNDRRIRVYDTNNDWKMKKDVYARNLRWTVTDTSLSSDQQFLVYSSLTPVVHMLNVTSGGVNSEANVTEVHEALHLDELDRDSSEGPNKLDYFGIFSVKWSHDSKFLCAGTGSGTSLILLYDVEKQKTVQSLRGHEDDVNAVAFMDETSNIIASGSDDYAIRIWDKRDPVGSSGALVGHMQGLTYLDPKGDGRYLLSNSKDQTAKIWDIRKMVDESTYEAHSSVELPYSQWDYRMNDHPGREMNVKHPHDTSVQTLRGHSVQSTLIRAHWSPMHTTGQRFVYTGSADGQIYIYDAITGKVVETLSYRRKNSGRTVIRDVSWHPHSASLVAAGFDGALVEFMHSNDSQEDHIERLPRTLHESAEDSHYW